MGWINGWQTYAKEVIFSVFVLSRLILCMSKNPPLPIHPCLQSSVYKCDLIHLPCITVLLITTLLFLIHLSHTSYHRVRLEMSSADGGLDHLMVISAALHVFIWYGKFFFFFVLECRKACERGCVVYSMWLILNICVYLCVGVHV